MPPQTSSPKKQKTKKLQVGKEEENEEEKEEEKVQEKEEEKVEEKVQEKEEEKVEDARRGHDNSKKLNLLLTMEGSTQS